MCVTFVMIVPLFKTPRKEGILSWGKKVIGNILPVFVSQGGQPIEYDMDDFGLGSD